MSWRAHRGRRAAMTALLAATTAAQDGTATSTSLADVLRTFAAAADKGDDDAPRPWRELLAALQHELPHADAAMRQALQKFALAGAPAPTAAADLATARSVWQLLAGSALLQQYRAHAVLDAAELEYEAGDEAEAVRLWEQSMQRGPWLRFHVLQRLFYACQDWRDSLRAREALARARAEDPADDAGKLRLALMECHDAARQGLYLAAHQALDTARARRGAKGLAPADLDAFAIAELDLALESGDYREGLRLAQALAAGATERATRHRAQLGVAIALGRSGDASQRSQAIGQLQQLLANAVRRNRAFLAQELAELLILDGQFERAASVAATLVAAPDLHDIPAPQRVTVVAAEVLATGDRLTAERRAQLLGITTAIWSQLVTEWRAMPQVGTGVAFLQQKFRRNVLALSFGLEAGTGDPGAVERCLQRYLEADSLGSAARRGNHPTPTVAEARMLLPADGVLLAYLPAETASYVFVVTRAAIALVPLPSSIGIETTGAELRRDLHRSTPADSAALRVRLDDAASLLLPEPLRARLANTASLTIAGRELCGGVPFECLPWPDAREPWLGLARSVGYVPSLTVAVAIAKAAATTAAGSGATVLVGSEVGAADQAKWHLQSLRLADGWRDELLGATDRAAVHLREPAHRGDLLQRGPRAALFAIVAHGILDGSRSRQNGMLLAAMAGEPTGAVWPEDIEALGPLGDLVYLGVCGAAAGSLKRGEDGAHHLGGAFLQAGASGVVISDHAITLDTAMTALLAITRSLAAGNTGPEALLAARRELWRGEASLASLAALRYEGLPCARPRLPAATANGKATLPLLAIGAAALAGLAGALALRRRTQRRRA